LAPKSQPAVELIQSDKQVAAWNAILQRLIAGREKIKTEIDSLNIENYLGTQVQPFSRRDKFNRPIVTGNEQLNDRLQKNRAAVPAKNAEEPPLPGGLPAAVSLALEIIDSSRSAPALLDQRALIKQLKIDCDAIESGIASLERLRDARLEELKYSQTLEDVGPWFALQVRKHRARQALAAVNDEEDDFIKSRLNAGYGPWRSDLLPVFGGRSKLALGSERDDDSEISRDRRRLEELGKL
jgi:hypothetical protein